MKKLIILAIFAGLSACDMPTLNLPSRGESEITVTRDSVTLTGPHGYCVDPSTTTRSSSSAFVVFGNCAAITGSFLTPQPEVNAIVTSTVRLADPGLPKISNSGAELNSYFNSTVGKIVISRANDPDKIEVLESGPNKEGAFFLYVNDTSDGAPEGTESTYWRGYFDAKNSVVTVSVLSLDASPLTRTEGLNILRQFSNAIQSVPSNATNPVEASATPITARPSQRPAS